VKRRRRVVVAATTWLLLLGLWILVDGVVGKQELVVGAVAAAVGALFAGAVARATKFHVRLPGWWGRAVLALPARLVTDQGLLIAAVGSALRGRGPRSDVVTVGVPAERSEARRAGARATAVMVLTATPNTVVIGEDGRGQLLVHRLVPTGDVRSRLTRPRAG
jgi:multisubunit Na+/H+ antiporter MnhE subunit